MSLSIEESAKKPDSFFVGETNKAVEERFKEREREACAIAEDKRQVKQNTITWSTSVDWCGFNRYISFAKTVDGRILHSEAAEGMVKLSVDRQVSYMTLEELSVHDKRILPYLEETWDHKVWR
jgi:beta-glucosidase/6-phospho-beta-glucosidase/beta-galactosidase